MNGSEVTRTVDQLKKHVTEIFGMKCEANVIASKDYPVSIWVELGEFETWNKDTRTFIEPTLDLLRDKLLENKLIHNHVTRVENSYKAEIEKLEEKIQRMAKSIELLTPYKNYHDLAMQLVPQYVVKENS